MSVRRPGTVTATPNVTLPCTRCMSDDGGMPILVSKGGEATGHDYQTSTGMTAGKFAANSTSRYTVKAPVAAPREDAAVANPVVFIILFNSRRSNGFKS